MHRDYGSEIATAVYALTEKGYDSLANKEHQWCTKKAKPGCDEKPDALGSPPHAMGLVQDYAQSCSPCTVLVPLHVPTEHAQELYSRILMIKISLCHKKYSHHPRLNERNLNAEAQEMH